MLLSPPATAQLGSWSLVIAALAGCATPPARPEGSYRTVQRTEIELGAAQPDVLDQGFRRPFRQRDVEGWISDSGRWDIETVVNHTHLRCGTYEVGIQLGRGNPGCAFAVWTSEPQFGTRELQCNSASMIHRGGGTLPVSPEQAAEATCLRVLVRCSGVCG
jgi:hypothetical protein